MATDRRQPYVAGTYQDQYTTQYGSGGRHPTSAAADTVKSMLPEHGPSTQQILAVVTLLPLGGILLLLAGLTLAGTLAGLAVTFPVFVICSPVIVPAALVIGMAVTGFLTSGAFGITALSSLSWMANYIRRMVGAPVGSSAMSQLDYAKRRAQDAAGQVGQTVGQKVRDVGQTVQSKAQETGGREGTTRSVA
ncbi:Oleosin H2 [Linum grandiflorum]